MPDLAIEVKNGLQPTPTDATMIPDKKE